MEEEADWKAESRLVASTSRKTVLRIYHHAVRLADVE